MSREASYGKTKLNNAREDVALKVLLDAQGPYFQKPDSKTRKRILELLDADGFSARAFDLIKSSEPLPPLTGANISEHIDRIGLVEVKATKAAIEDENLHGFFFGATDNEYRLAKHLGSRFEFAFVVLNPKLGGIPFYVLLSLEDVEARTRTKRVQYQVNLRGKPK